MTEDYRRRLYDAYVEASPTHYQMLATPAAFENLRAFYRATHGPWLPTSRSARILEVGCGSGQFCYFLQKEGYTRFEGVDASPQMLEVCRRMGVANARQGNALTHLHAHADEFDAIVANDFIEHLTKPEILDFLAHARAALRPGGRLIMKTPNAVRSEVRPSPSTSQASPILGWKFLSDGLSCKNSPIVKVELSGSRRLLILPSSSLGLVYGSYRNPAFNRTRDPRRASSWK